MPKVRYHVRLSESERKTLLKIITKGTASAKSIMHANVLLAADENAEGAKKSETEIAELFHVHPQTVHTIRQQYSEHGLQVALGRKKRRHHRLSPSLPERWKRRSLHSVAALHHLDDPNGH